MRVLALCLFLSSLAYADPITGEITSGHILFDTSPDLSSNSLRAPGHIITANILFEGCFMLLCTLEELRSENVISAGVGFILVDGIGYKCACGVLFDQVSFFDVVSGNSLTVTGETLTQGQFLIGYDPPSGPEVFRFFLPSRWKYRGAFVVDHDGGSTYRLETLELTSVPELGSLPLILSGLGCLGFLRRRSSAILLPQ